MVSSCQTFLSESALSLKAAKQLRVALSSSRTTEMGGFPSHFLPLVSLFCLLFVLFFETRPYSSQAILEHSIVQTGLGLITVILPQPPAALGIPKNISEPTEGRLTWSFRLSSAFR